MEKSREIIRREKKIKEKNPIGERLKQAVELLGHRNIADFIANRGLIKSTIYGLINQKKNPRSDTLNLLKDTGININWLLTGEGKPLLPRLDAPPNLDLSEHVDAASLAKDLENNLNQIRGTPVKNPIIRADEIAEAVKPMADLKRQVITALGMMEDDELELIEMVIPVIRDLKRKQSPPLGGAGGGG